MPQFDPVFFVSQIFWLLISFGGLYLGVYFVVFPLFECIFKERQKLIEVPLEKAEKLVEKTQQIQLQTEQKKALFEKQQNSYFNKIYQENTQRLSEKLQKVDKAFAISLKKTIHQLEQEEERLLKQKNSFIEKVVKGNL